MELVNKLAPCKQPKVPVVTNADNAVAYCLVKGCEGWGYGPGVKTDVEQQATWHRQHHRAQVPETEVKRPEEDKPYLATCGCGWAVCDGTTTTKADATVKVQHHLSHDHGVVTC